MEHNCQKILFNHFCCVMIAFLFNYGILFYAKYIRERHYHYTIHLQPQTQITYQKPISMFLIYARELLGWIGAAWEEKRLKYLFISLHKLNFPWLPIHHLLLPQCHSHCLAHCKLVVVSSIIVNVNQTEGLGAYTGWTVQFRKCNE